MVSFSSDPTGGAVSKCCLRSADLMDGDALNNSHLENWHLIRVFVVKILGRLSLTFFQADFESLPEPEGAGRAGTGEVIPGVAAPVGWCRFVKLRLRRILMFESLINV